MILVTGATGFVGNALVRRLAADPACTGVVAAVRRKSESRPERVQQVQVGDLLHTTDWGQALQGVERWDLSPIEQTRFWPAEGKPIRLWLEEG